MAKKIRFDEFVDQAGVAAGLKAVLDSLTLIEGKLKGISQLSKDAINVGDSKNLSNIKKTNKAIENSNKAFNAKKEIDKERIKLEQRLKKANSDTIQQNEEVKVQLQAQNKINKQLAREKLNLVGAYEKESQKLIKLRKQYKNLATSEKETSKESKVLLKEITALDSKLKKIDKTVGQSQRNVGNYGSAWNRVGSVFRGGLGVLGITAGLAGLKNLVGSSIGVFSSFQKANSNLEAVLGATASQMTELQGNAKQLGATTAFTASEVTGLQTSFAKLGFPTDQILLMTESTLNAAAAMGSGLDETAALTGATLKAFGLDATEAGRVNDVLAKSTSASALDFSKLSSSMSTIAPVANAFGFSVEGTTALLGQLSNAGFDASSSATATRNILLNLADANGDLAKSLGGPVKDLPSLVAGLKKLKGEGVDLGEALQLTDKRSVAAFSTFLEGADDVLALNDQLVNAGGTAQTMADTQLNNLEGSLTILNSAWEGFILSMEDGNGAFSRLLKNIVDVFTEILSLISGTEKLTSEMSEHEKVVRKYAKAFITVSKVLAGLVVTFVTYKAVMVASNTITKAYTVVTTLMRKAQAAMTAGVKGSTIAMKAFNAVTKANPIGLLVTVLALAVTAFIAFRDSATDAMKAQEAFNKALESGGEQAKKRIEERKKLSLESITALENEIAIRRAKGEDEKMLNEELARRRKEIFISELKDTEKRISNLKINAEKERNIILNKIKEIDKDISESTKRLGRDKSAESTIKRLKQQRTDLVIEAGASAGQIGARIRALTDESISLNKEIAQSDNDLTAVIAGNTTKNNKEYENRAKELELLRKKLEDIRNDLTAEEFERETKIIKTRFRREIEAIKGNSQVEKDLRIALKRQEAKELQELADKTFKASGKLKKEEDKKLAGGGVKSTALDDLIKEKEEELKLEQYYADRREEIQEALLNKLQEISDKRSENNIANIDKEIEANKSKQDQLRELAKRDVLGANESLGAEKKRAAELEKQRQEEVRKQELKTAGFKILSALLEQGKSPQEAIPEVGVLLAALPAVIDAIPTFFDGTEDTGRVNNPLDSKGGRLSMLHDNERVVDKENNLKMGGRSNSDVASIIQDYDRGLLSGLYDAQPKVINTNWQSNDQILNKFNSLESSILNANKKIEDAINNQPVLDAVKFNKITQQMTVAMKSANKTTNTTSKIKSSIFN